MLRRSICLQSVAISGLPGMGIAFVLTTGVYYLMCAAILRHSIGLRWTKQNRLLFLMLTLAAFVIRTLPYVGLERVRTPVALALTVPPVACRQLLVRHPERSWRPARTFHGWTQPSLNAVAANHAAA